MQYKKQTGQTLTQDVELEPKLQAEGFSLNQGYSSLDPCWCWVSLPQPNLRFESFVSQSDKRVAEVKTMAKMLAERKGKHISQQVIKTWHQELDTI
ncbi:hypothetical protein PCC7418_1273 [Halothece sp. PCC 7418]|uniref:hypothetical protein n=1 Tax=Halothece sp. (strain PCC 7418) TaxID=65093 RepID=UPI0002A06A2D|nr:hypothetical protein [Halothece sp. PCC 7418]AFZ43473.1 hypothetical protein PCC7418_1273 [Halothece sp. PCC 7418]